MEEKLKKFDLLLLEYKEDRITDEDFIVLQNMLKEDESLREHFVRAQALDAMLSVEEEFALPEEIYIKPKGSPKGDFSIIIKIAALLLISGVIVGSFLYQKSSKSTVIANMGEVGEGVLVIRDGLSIKLSEFEDVEAGDKIITGSKGALLSYLNERTTIFLKENSEVVFKIVKGAKVILLNKGDIICDVDKQPPGKPMKVLTPHAEATVLGTQFLLTATEDNSRLHVTEGSVNFRDKKSNETFEAKAGWTARISKKSDIKSFKHTLDKKLITIKNFTLINADTNEPFSQFDPIPDNALINLSELGTSNINLLANVELEPIYVGAVRFIMKAHSPEGKNIIIYDPRGKQRNNCVEGIFPFMFGGDTDDEPVTARAPPASPAAG